LLTFGDDMNDDDDQRKVEEDPGGGRSVRARRRGVLQEPLMCGINAMI
jgi:hypothetical protein